MIRNAHKVAGLLLGAFLLSTCAKTVPTVVEQEKIPLTFAVLQKGMASRALRKTEFPTDMSFGTFAYLLPPRKTWRDNSAEAISFIDNEKVYYHTASDGVFEAQSWHTSTPHYWPLGGNTLTFLSYAPYDALKDNISCSPATGLVLENRVFDYPTVAQPDVDVTDIMIAIAENQSRTNISAAPNGSWHTGVPTTFQHICSLIKIDVKLNNPDNSGKIFTVTGIEIDQVYKQGTFSQYLWRDYKFPVSISCSTTAVANPDGITKTEVLPETIILPQELVASSPGITDPDKVRTDPSFTLHYSIQDGDYTDTGSITRTFKQIDTRFVSTKPGHKYVMTITFNTQDDYVEFTTSVQPWGIDIVPNN